MMLVEPPGETRPTINVAIATVIEASSAPTVVSVSPILNRLIPKKSSKISK
jgi:hypothetical protein